ncbi:MAG: hypothetical protein EOP34_09720 [Rickettsiales bacterium]|nr:MAG: hypothetical protein EOP34_09720 [Rickettsiales bacterium]
MDVRYNDPVPGSRGLKFVYDRRDPSGAKLRTLFAGKGYQEHTIGTRRGFLIGGAGRSMGYTQPNTIKVAALEPQVAEVEQSAFITSNLLPIDKTFNGRGGVSLKAEKNMDTWV